jgi:hypothetical protein
MMSMSSLESPLPPDPMMLMSSLRRGPWRRGVVRRSVILSRHVHASTSCFTRQVDSTLGRAAITEVLATNLWRCDAETNDLSAQKAAEHGI